MTSHDIRIRFLEFFKKRGHAVIPSAPLVPENDPSVLFNTAGMQPLVPYLLGQPHPLGTRIVDIQKCVRTQDIGEVGDATHDTFFEMLGNWSLGDYFKKDAITWSYEFLTNKEEGLGLDSARLYVTVFAGDERAPVDAESMEIWQSLGVPARRIYAMEGDSNWWSPGENGPCGPDSEMFYDITTHGLGDLTREEFLAADERQDVVEVWNDVFMEFEKKDGVVIGKLSQQNVDTGAGMERLAMVVQGVNNIFQTDLFSATMATIKELATSFDVTSARIVADHARTAVFIIADGVIASNTDRGYILRRLLRRAVRYADVLGLPARSLAVLVEGIVETYGDTYSLSIHSERIKSSIIAEEDKFRQTLKAGLKKFEELASDHITGAEAFTLFSTYGFPFEMTKELANERNILVDEESYQAEIKKHQDKSREGAEQKFKGGLADHSEMSVRYHTATHLLQFALREVLGTHVIQKGSNITSERLRFDFSHTAKMTDEEKKSVVALVNKKIQEAISVTHEDVPLDEARKRGAIGLFEEKYGDLVRIYRIGDFSLEFCGGPHVTNTSELGTFSILKEEAVAAGIRRIKAVLT
ncbi:MAG: alanine--tRNA ligase [bacterium]|nr:alanine--tRNA ligase [bacterium]